jgi:acyl dehydratase
MQTHDAPTLATLTQWVPVDQAHINAFADFMGDHQWIHVDVERAAKESPLAMLIPS